MQLPIALFLPFCHFCWQKVALLTYQPKPRTVVGTPFAVLCRKEKRKLTYPENLKLQSNMNLTPLADRVIIKPAPAETKTVGGIIIPDTAKEKPLQGEVLAVGQGTKDEAMILKAGDHVLYGKYAGTEVEFDGEKLLIMRQSDVLARFN